MDFKSQSIAQLEETISEAQGILNEKKAARRAELLAELEGLGKPVKVKTSVKVKYRAPDGQTWGGRGALPTWAKNLGVTDRAGMERYRV